MATGRAATTSRGGATARLDRRASSASIARVVASPCVFALVRAATIGSDVNLANCHPFAHGRHLFMHNGHIGGFRAVRRPLLESLTDEAFHVVRGSTDTEHLFALFVDEIVRAERSDRRRRTCPTAPRSSGAGSGGR